MKSHRAGLFLRQRILPNLLPGLLVGVVALPLAMAFAIASGAKPEQGVYTAIIASLLISILDGSRVHIGGPTGAFIVILFGISHKYGIDGLQIATLIWPVLFWSSWASPNSAALSIPLEEMITRLQKRHTRVMICGANPLVARKLAHAGITHQLAWKTSIPTWQAHSMWLIFDH